MSLYRSIKSNRPIAISKTEPTIPPIIACLLWLTFIPKSNNHPANKKPQPIKRYIDIFSLFYNIIICFNIIINVRMKGIINSLKYGSIVYKKHIFKIVMIIELS